VVLQYQEIIAVKAEGQTQQASSSDGKYKKSISFDYWISNVCYAVLTKILQHWAVKSMQSQRAQEPVLWQTTGCMIEFLFPAGVETPLYRFVQIGFGAHSIRYL
jgi:hypothetical protein